MNSLADDVVARGRRVILRRKRLSDAKDDYGWRSDEELSAFLADRIPDEIFRTFVIFESDELRDVSEPAGTAAIAGWVAVGIVVVLVLMLILFTQRVSVSFLAIGIALVLGALASAVIVPLARETARAATTDDAYRTLGLNLFDELVRSLSLRTWFIGVAGAVMIAVGLIALFAERRRAEPGSVIA